MTRFLSWVAVAILVGAVGACGPFCGNGKLNFSNAQINPTSFTCPAGSTSYGYNMTGSVDADNQTNGTVTIKKMSTASTVTATHGNWSGAVGDKSGADNLPFSPRTIASGTKASLKFTTYWSCNSSGNDPTTYADFAIVLTIVASSGTYKVNLPKHRLKMG